MLGSFFSGSRIQHPIVLFMITIGLFLWYTIQTDPGLLSWYFWGMEYDLFGRWAQTLGIIFWIIGGLWLNRVVNHIGFIGQHYYVPVFSVFVGISLMNTSFFLQISQAFLFFSIFIAMLNRINKDHTSTFFVFDTGLVIGVLACFHIQYIVFLVFVWIFLAVYGVSFIRFILISIAGVLTMGILVSTAWKVLQFKFSTLQTYRIPNSLPESLLNSNKLVFLAILGILFMLTLTEIRVAISRGNISKRHFATFGLLVLLISILASISFSALPVLAGCFLGFILLFIANRMNHLSGKRREIVFYSLLSVVIALPMLINMLS
jgi:hypothetical protein